VPPGSGMATFQSQTSFAAAYRIPVIEENVLVYFRKAQREVGHPVHAWLFQSILVHVPPITVGVLSLLSFPSMKPVK
jgi:hypothetical protein